MNNVRFPVGDSQYDSKFVREAHGVFTITGNIYVKIDGVTYDAHYVLDGIKFVVHRLWRLTPEEANNLNLKLPVNNWEYRQAA